jgi:hypothetical protein
MERFNSTYKALLEPLLVELTFGALEALLIEVPVIEAPIIEVSVIEALLIKALLVYTDINEPLNTDSFTFEALLVETNEPAIPFINTTEPLTFTLETNKRTKPLVETTFTFIIDYYFAGSSIPKSLSTTTLTLPPLISTTGFRYFYFL